jgi:CheY-like chemotaxis protein
VVALYAELDERAEQLRQASELKTKFLSNMSHEFRTPLNSILALSRLLLDRIDGDLTAEQERQVGYIRRSAESLLELVNDLLDLAKVEAGKVDIRPSAFTVGNLFSGLRGALKPLLTSPSVELIFDIPDQVPELFTDEAKVTQILRNLISNALKFTEQGEVRVTASYDDAQDRVRLSVRDTGIGIAPTDQSRIFEEFSQVDTRIQKRVKGTGLGLPLSRSLAELLGGELTVESVPGQGSVFMLSIPPERGDPSRAQRSADNARKRVLLIDDDETFRYVMRQIISSEPRYEFLEAKDGDVGLKAAREQRPDVIILDLQMPTMDGFTVLQELNADGRTSVTPVIVSTSLNVNAELKARLPAGTRVISKNTISRENVSLFLRDATTGAA